MADTVIENLVTKLSFVFKDAELKKFDKHLKNVTKGLAAIVSGASAAATAVFAFTKKMAESNDEIGKFAQRTGIGIEALQELGFVAELNGGSIDSMNSSLQNLSRIASEAARGVGAGVEVFGLLGISVTESNGQIKEADVLFNNVSDAISRLGTQAQKLEFTQKLGIGPDLLLSIQQGSEALMQQREEARKLGFIIDTQAAKASADFVDELLRLKKIFTGTALGTGLIKQITPVLKAFTEWFKVNRTLIQQNINRFLQKAITTIRGVFNVALRVVGVINGLVDAMGGWKNSIIAVTGVLVAMNASALLMPILAVAAGAGILLVLEDVIKFAEGGESAVGELAEKFPLFDAFLRTTLDLLGMARDGWVLLLTEGDAAFEGMMLMLQDLRKEIPLLDQALNGVFDVFDMIIEGWRLIFTEGGAAFEGMVLMIRDVGDSIAEFIIAPINKVIELMNKILGINIETIGVEEIMIPAQTGAADIDPAALSELEGIIGISMANMISRTHQANLAANTPIMGNTATSNISNVSTTTNKPNVSITINGGDTEKVKQTINDVLNEQYSGAQTNLESQVEF